MGNLAEMIGDFPSMGIQARPALKALIDGLNDESADVFAHHACRRDS